MSDEPSVEGRRIPRVRGLLVSRTVDQAVIGLASLGLARELGLDAFAAISVLLVVNSLAVTASDFGVGTSVLRHEKRETVALSVMSRLRLANGSFAALAVVAGALIGGETGLIVAAAGLMWALSGEAYVRKSSVVKQGLEREAVVAELLSAVVFALFSIAAFARPDDAVWLVAAGFTLKHAVEVPVAHSWRGMFSPSGDVVRLGAIWGTQMLAYATANLDYLVIGLFFTPAAFSVYVLAFRIANVIPSQITFAVSRVSLVAFAHDELRVQHTYDRYVRNLFLVGIGAAVATGAVALVLPGILGEEWEAIVAVLLVLAVGVPWRMVLGVSGSLALAADAASQLLRWETARLIVTAASLALAAALGFGLFVYMVSLLAIGAVVIYHRLAGGVAGVRAWPTLVPAAVFSALLAVIPALAVELPTN